MKTTIALRYGEHFAPECGTIAAHQQLIQKHGFVWYGKMGAIPGKNVIDSLFKTENPKILLIQSGKTGRHWAYVSEFSKLTPPLQFIPAYYRNRHEAFSCWFKILYIEPAEKNVMALCRVKSSGAILGEVSKSSLNPYFIIEYDDRRDE